MMKVRTAAALAAGLMLVAGCGTAGLETGAGTVEKKTAEAFLATAEADWRQRVDNEPNKNLSADGRCYFVTGAEGNKSLGTLACGPLRRLGSAGGEVWDTVRVESTGGDKPGVEIPDNEPWKTGQVRPASSGLWRPDDKAATADADKLAAPPAPAAAAGMTMISDTRYSLELEPASERLVVPDGTVTLKGLATPDVIGAGAEAKGPASGEKFVVATFTTAETIDPLTGLAATGPAPDSGTFGEERDTKTTVWTVTVGGQQRPVEVLPEREAGDTTASTLRTIIVSVPVNTADVLLTATNGSVVQSLSLTTGKRTTPDVAATYYRRGVVAQLDKAIPAKALNQGRDFTSTYSLELAKAALAPWDPEKGWAPTGKVWFRMSCESKLEYPDSLYDLTWNPAFLTATADGATVATGRGGCVNGFSAWLVPATVKTVQVKAAASMTFRSNGASRYTLPLSGAGSYGTLAATATFQ